MKNKQIKLFADVCDSGRQTFIVPDKSGSAGIAGGFVPVGKKPAVFETSVRFGADRVVIRGMFERGFGDAKAVKPLRMKAYGWL